MDIQPLVGIRNEGTACRCCLLRKYLGMLTPLQPCIWHVLQLVSLLLTYDLFFSKYLLLGPGTIRDTTTASRVKTLIAAWAAFL